MLMWDMNDKEDQDLRGYARWLHENLGEDAYHDAICDVLTSDQVLLIRNPRAFWRTAIKRRLYKAFRRMKTDRELSAFYINGDPPPTATGLALGRQKHENCRRGHPLTEDNLAYIGPRRTCRTCKRTREAAAARQKRQQLRAIG